MHDMNKTIRGLSIIKTEITREKLTNRGQILSFKKKRKKEKD